MKRRRKLEPTRMKQGRLLALPINIRLDWKGLPETNVLTYYVKAKLTAVKSFITLATGGPSSTRSTWAECSSDHSASD
jgi:hypothetical protein